MPTDKEAREFLDNMLADEMAQYGVEGMRWGVRKDHPSGSSASPSGEKKSTSGTVKVSQTKDTKLSEGQKVAIGYGAVGAVLIGPGLADGAKTGVGYLGAPLYKEIIAEDLKKIEKYTGAVDRAKDFLNDSVDTSLPAGTTFHRVASYKETEVNAAKYATYLENDVLRYRNSWVTPGRTSWHPHYVTKLEATKALTIASPDSIYASLVKDLHTILDDGDSIFDKMEKQYGFSKYMSNPKDLSAKAVVDEIIRHNRSNIWADDVGRATAQIMLKNGYSAVTDINNTGSQARKHAVIILDKTAFNVSSTRLSTFERAAAKVAQNKLATATVTNVVKSVVT